MSWSACKLLWFAVQYMNVIYSEFNSMIRESNSLELGDGWLVGSERIQSLALSEFIVC